MQASNAAPVHNATSKVVLPVNERLAVTVKVAAEYSGISRTRIYELLASGDLEGKVVRGRRVILVQSLTRFVTGSASAAKTCATAQT